MARTEKEIAILATTLNLIAERGFHNTPVSLIARQSGVSAGIIYHYFDNKDALIHDLYYDIKLRYAAALMQADQTLAWVPYFEQLWCNAFDFYVQHPKETLFLEQYENSPFGQHMDEEAIQASGDENAIGLIQMMRRRQAEGVIRDLPFVVIYELTFGVAVGLAKRQINGAIHLEQDTLVQIADACRRAIEP